MNTKLNLLFVFIVVLFLGATYTSADETNFLDDKNQ
ncbi:hypothetical protein BpOF4_21479 (plasmid) [Alkalihalophilus pseudofirmus OF4]|uniref:Uncharacterized protein n=1 Tax=Alkalihalophilus pseudofirmus (strain ATCC BAA-2126 / JCM 17055 / OF4) TaxID=398511 RepID=D3G1R5_ALKPO|nr:hypothetical protein BpOF4_21479 [Alkalihalophilus pseudofirmus OF4]